MIYSVEEIHFAYRHSILHDQKASWWRRGSVMELEHCNDMAVAGGAGVSTQHLNFIVNTGQATASTCSPL